MRRCIRRRHMMPVQGALVNVANLATIPIRPNASPRFTAVSIEGVGFAMKATYLRHPSQPRP
jgi:hypothetical protein